MPSSFLPLKVISGVVTLAILGGLGYYFLTRGGDDDDDKDTTSASGSSNSDEDLSDPLSEARRIM